MAATIGAPEVMAKKDIEFDKDYASETVVRTWRGLRGDIPNHYRHVTYEPHVWWLAVAASASEGGSTKGLHFWWCSSSMESRFLG
jgi:hypothetical protein